MILRSEATQKAQELLKSAGLRVTAPRMAILATLLEAGKPVTQDQIAANLGQVSPNKVTIYRTLESLVNAGIVHKVFLQERTWHFEPAHNCTETQCHAHFTCTQCGDTNCLTEISIPMTKSPHKGFVINRQQVQFEGLCPNCNSKL